MKLSKDKLVRMPLVVLLTLSMALATAMAIASAAPAWAKAAKEPGAAADLWQVSASEEGNKTVAAGDDENDFELLADGYLPDGKSSIVASGKDFDYDDEFNLKWCYDWTIDSDGVLTVTPGTVEGFVGWSNNWRSYGNNYSSLITSVKFVSSGGLKVVTDDCRHMFADCTALTDVDLAGLDTTCVEDMSYMFKGCKSLRAIDLSGLNTPALKEARHMFYECTSLESVTMSGWKSPLLTEAYGLFQSCDSLKQVDLANWTCPSVTTMGGIFEGCTSLTKVALNSVCTSAVEDMSEMFRDCVSLACVDLRQLDTSSATTIEGMFYGCSSLASLDVSHWQTAAVTSMRDVFHDCSSLTTLDVSDWDTAAVTEMSWMFSGCSNLVSTGNLGAWSTSRVASFWSMFDGCSSLRECDCSGWDTSGATNGMDHMFEDCCFDSFRVGDAFSISTYNNYDWVADDCVPGSSADDGKWWSERDGCRYTRKQVADRCAEGIADTYLSDGFCELDPVASAVANGSAVYDGKSHKAQVKEYMHIKCVNDHGDDAGIWGKVLKEGEHYEVSYYNRGSGKANDLTSAGTVEVTVTGVNGHVDVLTSTFVIEPQPLSSSRMSLEKKSYTYTGSAIKPKVTLKSAQGATLKEGIDYTLAYKSNKVVGTATVVATGKGNYTGNAKAVFTIAKAASTIKLAAQTKTYTGKAIAYSGKVTRTGSTGKVTYAYYSDSACKKVVVAAHVKDAGTYYVKATVAADANHKSATSAAAKFKVNKAANPLAVKAVTRIASAKALKTKAVTVTAPVSVSKAQGKVSYVMVTSGSSAALTVNKTTGNVTVKKGTKNGTYTIKMKVVAAGNANYKSDSKMVTCKITVK